MTYFTFQQERLSRVALGCDHFGETTDRDVALRLMDRYAEAGGNVLDVAHAYGQAEDGGHSQSERTVGAWLKANRSRSGMFLVTKGGHPSHHDMHASRLEPDQLKADLDGSLDDLGTDRIDLYFLHRDRPDVPADELMDMAGEIAVASGTCRYLGASNWKADRIAAANAWAKAHGKPGFLFSEIQYSLAYCDPVQWRDDTLVCMDDEERAFYARTGMPVLVFSSQAKGYFSKKIEGGTLGTRAAFRFDTPGNQAMVPVVRRIAAGLHLPAAAVATGWLLSQPDVRLVPIISASKESQLAQTLATIDVRLDAEQMRDLDEARAKSSQFSTTTY